MRRGLLAAMLATIITSVASVVAADVGTGSLPPSSPDQRAKVVALVRSLETEPLGSGAKASRETLLVWLIGVTDISVKACLFLLRSFHEVKRYPYDAEIGLQAEFAETE